jgi:hypothetical protein
MEQTLDKKRLAWNFITNASQSFTSLALTWLLWLLAVRIAV